MRKAETVQVQGAGHLLRSTGGRKDRHSKVYTAKGPRDRRVRLAAQTAIEFYDVQDRLGFDRASKAVDWLMKKAKTAIDNLAELPPWNPDQIDQNPPFQVQPSFLPPPLMSDEGLFSGLVPVNFPAASYPEMNPFFGHGSVFSQREPLQSSFTPSFRGWSDHSELLHPSLLEEEHGPFSGSLHSHH